MPTKLAPVPSGRTPATELQRYACNGPTMGTRFAAVFYACPGIDTASTRAKLQAAVNLVDAQMSTWKPDSDVSRINQAGCGVWLDVPPDLARVIAAGLDIGIASRGAFDIGVGDLTDAWGFGSAGQSPDQDRIAQAIHARRANAIDRLELDRAHGRLRKLGKIGLDLSGIAKGYGVDALARVLDEAGIGDYLVSIDGELRTKGLKPALKRWAIAIERPLRNARDAGCVLELTDRAVATSGDYRRWVQVDGSLCSHTMDPRTARPLANRIASVTVVARDCMEADAWATALMVLGEAEGPQLAADRGLDALFVVRDPGGLLEMPVGIFAGQAFSPMMADDFLLRGR